MGALGCVAGAELAASAAQARVEQVAHRIAQHVETVHHDRQAQPGPQRQPRRLLHEPPPLPAEHPAPARDLDGQPEAEKAQAGLGQDDTADVDAEDDDQGRHDIGQNVAHQDLSRRRADRPGGQKKVVALGGHHGASDHARAAHPAGDPEPTGLRVSEALDLRFDDLLPNSVLCIRRTKFAKSRLVPLHPTTVEALTEYLHERQSVAIADDHLFVSANHRRIPTPTASGTFQRVVRLASIAVGRQRRPRMVDLRHTFATRSLQRCAVRRESVARHLVALSTYLGHTNVVHTYWYLEATPELMADIATTGENFVSGRLA